MARYTKELVLNKEESFVTFMMNDFLQKNQFKPFDYKTGEKVYRAGDPMLEGYKYVKWSYENGTLHLEAWMQSGFGKEAGLDGFAGSLQKKPFKNSLEQLYNVLQQDIEIPKGEDGQPLMSSIPVTTVDNSKAATQSLVFGILAIVSVFVPLLFGYVIGIIPILLGVIGTNRARLGSGSSKSGAAKAGKVLSIIAIVLAFVLFVGIRMLNAAFGA